MAEIKKEEIDAMRVLIRSPLAFIEKFWSLVPQPLICEREHEHLFSCFGEFEMGRHITWQQARVLKAIEEGAKRISVVSGNGVGKDALLVWIIHWFLFTRYEAQIGCTAPSADQLYDVLWKELAKWKNKLPKGIQEKFIWSTDRYRFAESPEVWWARARTARRESPEAFAGLHGEHVLLIGDEASAIPDEIYSSGEGALTGEHTLVILVSNGTRTEGYFYDTHHKFQAQWSLFSFDGRESPIVKQDFLNEVIAKYGEDSDEFRWKVAGLFPRVEGMDEKGWLPLLVEADLRYCPDVGSFKNPALGIDPSGEGSNKTAMVARDPFMAKVLLEEAVSTSKGIADKALTFGIHYHIPVGRMKIDSFGVGANVSQELAIASGERATAVNVGEKADDSERFVNRRAELAWRTREWLLKGGQLVKHKSWKQVLHIRYKRTGSGKIQIMSKVDMKSIYGYDSPDVYDALSLTFLGDNEPLSGEQRKDEMSGEEVAKLIAVY